MKTTVTIASMLFSSILALPASPPDFSGTWTFVPGMSKNVGMMTQMKMTQIIAESPSALDVTSKTNFQGNDQVMKTHYDLSGKSATNDSPMAGPSQTVSHWDGDKLVTIWTSNGAVAGTRTVRTETRFLSQKGKIMTVQSVRGAGTPVVMVFARE